jgi:hypothetical protein
MEKAKQLLPDNEIVSGMILQEVVRLLAPKGEVQEYSEAVISSLPQQLQQLALEQESEIYTRDLGSQIPIEREEGSVEEDIEEREDAMYANAGIQQTGQSFTTQDAIAVQLSGMNVGR